MATFTMPSKEKRDELFHRFDPNGNGLLSLAEIDKAIVELFPGFNNKPALMRAYHAADKTNDGFIERKEFRLLLGYIIYFNEVWKEFEALDANGDRRLSLDEFRSGCAKLGLEITPQNAAAEFKKIDKNGGGVILFDEFCSWIVKKKVPHFEEN